MTERGPRLEDVEDLNARLHARNQHQSALAALSLLALRTGTLDAVLNHVAVVATRILDVDACALLEFVPGEEPMTRAGTPIEAGTPGVSDIQVPGRNHPWGLMRVRGRQLRLSTDDAECLRSLATVIGLAAECEEQQSARRARAETEAALDKLQAIQSITDSTLVTLTVDEMLAELLARLRRRLNCDNAVVYLVDAEKPQLYPRAFVGVVMDTIRELRVPFGAGVAGRIYSERRPLIVDEVSSVDLSRLTGVNVDEILANWRSTMGAPLRVGDKVIGVVTVASMAPRRFVADDLNLLLLVADRVGPIIERRSLVESLRGTHQRLRMLSRQLLAAQEEGRRQIAVELHDGLGQVLTAAKINMESAARTTGEEAREQLKEAVACIDQATQQVREMVLNLRPSVLDDLGLAAALRWHVDQFARRTGIRTHQVIAAVPKLSPGLEITCFRIAQEVLTNVTRHAQARNVWFSLQYGQRSISLTVRDDGVGFDVAAARARAISGTSMGLLGMEERAASVGGTLILTSAGGRGSEVSVTLPLKHSGTGPA